MERRRPPRWRPRSRTSHSTIHDQPSNSSLWVSSSSPEEKLLIEITALKEKGKKVHRRGGSYE